MKKLIRITLVCLICSIASPALAQTTAPATQPISVTELGAVGDGKTLNTAAIQKALNIASAKGGGEVVIPAGNFVSGSLVIGPGVTVRMEKDAVLTGSTNLADYAIVNVRWEGEWQAGHRALLFANNADRIAIVGEGMIVGPPFELSNLRPNADTGTARGPVLIEPIDCRDVRIEGISLQYQRMWSIHLTYCQDAVVRNVTIRSPSGPGLANGGGIDVDSCKNVLLEGCDIETGDDAIMLSSGRGIEAARIARPTEDVILRNCKLSSPNYAALSLGPEMTGGIRNVRIESCTLSRSIHAIHIKSRLGRGGFIDNIALEGGQIQGPRTAITIDLDNAGAVGSQPLTGADKFAKVSNLAFNNFRVLATHLITATAIAREMPMENVTLSNVTGQSPEGIQVANIRNLTLKNIRLTGYLGEFLQAKNVTGPNIENIRSPRDTLEAGATMPASE